MEKITKMSEEEIRFEIKVKVYASIINAIKRKRPIQNQRLDSFSWWIYVEKAIQDELLKYPLEEF